jgi:carbamate kinase
VLVVCAGGGIPVVVEAGRVCGVEAAIAKNLAAALVAPRLDARLLLLTDVPAVELDWGTPRARPLRMTTPAELRA